MVEVAAILEVEEEDSVEAETGSTIEEALQISLDYLLLTILDRISSKLDLELDAGSEEEMAQTSFIFVREMAQMTIK